MRKLPVYILVDVSESMCGRAIEDVNTSIQRMIAALRRNPYALETVWLSVIGFDSIARVLTPLTDICEFVAPRLQPRPGTALGDALRLTRQRIQAEVVPTTAERKGDWRPMVFLLTDGQPTDNWREAAVALRSQSPRPSKIYAIGIGEEVDYSVLKEIADVTYRIDDIADGVLEDLFVWMSASIQQASLCLEKGAPDVAPATPKGIEEVGNDYAPAPTFPRQLFFHLTCKKTKKKYLARYRYQDSQGVYTPSETYPLSEEFFSDAAGDAPQVDLSQICGCPVCPYCGEQAWFICNCGGYSDVAYDTEICPVCGNPVGVINSISDERFRLNQSRG